MRDIFREPEAEKAAEAQMRLFLTTEDIYFHPSGLVLKVLLQFHAESGDLSRISGF